jgi:hypothetical protein
MTQTYRRRAAISAALAAFGLGSFLTTQTASAQPARPNADTDHDGVRNRRDRDDDNDGIPDRADKQPLRKNVQGRVYVQPRRTREVWTFNYRPLRYDARHYDDLDSYDLGFGFDRPDFYNRFERDYMAWDRNGDGRLSYFERQGFWIHMANVGMFGPMTRAQAREMGSIAASFDSNGNGRLTQYELRRLSRFIKARQLFVAFDRHRDGRLRRGETRGWMFNEFPALDMNRDRFVTMHELRSYFLARPRAHYWGR